MIRCLFFFFFFFTPPINIAEEIEKASKLNGLEEIHYLKNLLTKIKYDKDSSAFIELKLGNRYEREGFPNSKYWDSAKYYYVLAYNYLLKNNTINKASRATIKLASFYRKTQSPDLAFKTLHDGFDFVDFPNFSEFLAETTQLFIDNNNYNLNIPTLHFQKKILDHYSNSDKDQIYENLIKLSKQDTINRNLASIGYLKEALILVEKEPSLLHKRTLVLNELGIRYKEFGDFKNAEFYYNKMKDDTLSENLIRYHNNIADLYTATKKYNLSAFHRKKAYDLILSYSEKNTNNINNLATNILGMAELKDKLNQLDSAIYYINLSLSTYSIDKEGLDKTEFLKNILERKIYKYNLHLKIDKTYFDIAQIKEIDTITDALRKRQTDEASKAELRSTAIEFYKIAATNCIDHKQLKFALYFKEKAKSLLLLENYLQLTNEKEIIAFKYAIEDFLKLPNPDTSAFIQTFEKLKPVISLLVKKYETNQSVKNEVFYDAIEKSISQNPKDHVYLDFFETEKEMLVFRITDHIDIHRLSLNPEIKAITLAYNDSIHAKGNLCLAPIIYDAIIKPLGPLQKNITIIPDGYLSYLPFEALHTGINQDEEDLTTYDFLIKHHNIDYNYSLGMATLMEDKKVISKGTHVFLPDFDFSSPEKDYAEERQLLIPLKYAKEEASAINEIFNTTFYEKQSANKDNFVNSLATANVIHFAGHAILNNENHHLSYLAFDSQEKDESRLYLKEIAGVSTNAELIVLSACQTAAGKYAAGEGFLSLGRAMVACGSKSIVTSLWNVYDSSGKDIIAGFYKNLKQGQNKSNALHNSKIDFINNVTSSKKAHPYHWSAFVFIGDNVPLHQSSIGWKSILIGVCGATILAYSFLSFRKKK